MARAPLFTPKVRIVVLYGYNDSTTIATVTVTFDAFAWMFRADFWGEET